MISRLSLGEKLKLWVPMLILFLMLLAVFCYFGYKYHEMANDSWFQRNSPAPPTTPPTPPHHPMSAPARLQPPPPPPPLRPMHRREVPAVARERPAGSCESGVGMRV